MKNFIPMLLIVYLFGGCTKPTQPGPNSLTQTIVLDQIVYTLSIRDNKIDLADSLRIEFSVENQSHLVKEFSFPQYPWFQFKLVNTAGTVVLRYPILSAAWYYQFFLQPGETKAYVVAHAFLDDKGNPLNLSPGVYTLHAGLYKEGARVLSLQLYLNTG